MIRLKYESHQTSFLLRSFLTDAIPISLGKLVKHNYILLIYTKHQKFGQTHFMLLTFICGIMHLRGDFFNVSLRNWTAEIYNSSIHVHSIFIQFQKQYKFVLHLLYAVCMSWRKTNGIDMFYQESYQGK